jgi:hypothetical protein
MARKEEVLGSATLLGVLPVLSSSVLENLAVDLERAVRDVPKHNNGLREVAVAVRLFYEQAKRKDERTESGLFFLLGVLYLDQ